MIKAQCLVFNKLETSFKLDQNLLYFCQFVYIPTSKPYRHEINHFSSSKGEKKVFF